MKKTFIPGLLAVAVMVAAASPVVVSAQPVVQVTGSGSGPFNSSMPNVQTGLLQTSPYNSQAQNYQNTLNAQVFSVSSSGGACGNFATSGLSGVVNCVVAVLNQIVYILMAAGVVYTVWGAFQMIQSEEKREAGRQTVIYGIIGLFVMISIWGFVNILDRTFNLSGVGAHKPPQLIVQ